MAKGACLPTANTSDTPATATSPETTHDLPLALTADEIAVLLRVNKKTVYALAASGELPARRMGRVVRFHRDAVLRWLAEGQGRAPRSRRNS